MIKFRPDMNEITYEEEKAVLILGITAIFTLWWMFQMIYFLLAFVVKYVYIKTLQSSRLVQGKGSNPLKVLIKEK